MTIHNIFNGLPEFPKLPELSLDVTCPRRPTKPRAYANISDTTCGVAP